MGPMKGYGGAVDRPRTAIDVTLETSQSAMFELNLGAASNIYCEARVGRSGHKWCIGTMSLLLGRRSIDVKAGGATHADTVCVGDVPVCNIRAKLRIVIKHRLSPTNMSLLCGWL